MSETEWEKVNEGAVRLEVPGGWLYQTWLLDFLTGSVSPETVRVTFVPEPKKEGK